MARPKKKTVDYFPHNCKHGRTVYILESKYGNEGYCFWFKLLELLGDTDNHFIDCNDLYKWQFLQARTKTDPLTCEEILNTLADLDAIDPELWDYRIIWSANFVANLTPVYLNRRTEPPTRPKIPKGYERISTRKNPITTPHNPISTGKNPITTGRKTTKDSIVKESKEKKRKDKREPFSSKIFDEIFQKWNSFAIQFNLSPIDDLSPNRKDKIKRRIKEGMNFDKVLDAIPYQSFLLGEKGWKVNFDFIFHNDTNWLKIIEKGYGGSSRYKPKVGGKVEIPDDDPIRNLK